MTIQYLDPYKDNKFGRLKGSKHDTYFKAVFSEAKFYKHENAYILAGQFESFIGIERAYGNDPINPGLVELAIYGSEYEIRQKKAGTGENGTKKEYESIKIQPSVAESLLYKHIEDNPSQYLEDKAFSGDITFYPDDNYTAIAEDDARLVHVLNNAHFEAVTPTGKYPDWIAPEPYTKSGKSGSWSITPQQKLAFLKEELRGTVNAHSVRENKDLPIAAYIHQILAENEDKENFLVCYFDLVKALIN